MEYTKIPDTFPAEEISKEAPLYSRLNKSSVSRILEKLDQSTKLKLPLLNTQFNNLFKNNPLITNLSLYYARAFISDEMLKSYLFESGYFKGLTHLSLERCRTIPLKSIQKLYQHFPYLTHLNLTKCHQVDLNTAKSLLNNCLNLKYLELYKTKLKQEEIIELFNTQKVKLGFAAVKAFCKQNLKLPHISLIWPSALLTQSSSSHLRRIEFSNSETLKTAITSSSILNTKKAQSKIKTPFNSSPSFSSSFLIKNINNNNFINEPVVCSKSKSISSPCFGGVKVFPLYSLNVSLTPGPFPITQISLCSKHLASSSISRCDYCRLYYTSNTINNFLCHYCMDKTLFSSFKNPENKEININTVINNTITINQKKNFLDSLNYIQDLNFPDLNFPTAGSIPFKEIVKNNEDGFTDLNNDLNLLNTKVKSEGYKETWFISNKNNLNIWGSFEKNLYSSNVGVTRFVQQNILYFFGIISAVLLLTALINSFTFYKEIKVQSSLFPVTSPLSLIGNNGGPAMPFMYICSLVAIPLLVWLGTKFIVLVLVFFLPFFFLLNLIVSIVLLNPIFELILGPFKFGYGLNFFFHLNLASLLTAGIFKTHKSPSHVVAIIFLYTYIGSILGTLLTSFFIYAFLFSAYVAFNGSPEEDLTLDFFFRHHGGIEEYMPNIFISKNGVVMRPFEILVVPALIGTVGIKSSAVFLTAFTFMSMLLYKMNRDNNEEDKNDVKLVYFFVVVLCMRYINDYIDQVY